MRHDLVYWGLKPRDLSFAAVPRVEGGIVGITAAIIPTSSLHQSGDAFVFTVERHGCNVRSPIPTQNKSATGK